MILSGPPVGFESITWEPQLSSGSHSKSFLYFLHLPLNGFLIEYSNFTLLWGQFSPIGLTQRNDDKLEYVVLCNNVELYIINI